MGTLKLFDGNDWQKIVGSGGEKPWRLIGDVTTTEAVGEVKFDKDADGNDLSLTELIIVIDAETLITGQPLAVFGSKQSGAKNYLCWKSNASLGSNGNNRFIVRAYCDTESGTWVSMNGVSTGGSGSGSVVFCGQGTNTITPFDGVRVNTNSATTKYPVGIKVTVWGR